jgi:hypothetical protein
MGKARVEVTDRIEVAIYRPYARFSHARRAGDRVGVVRIPNKWFAGNREAVARIEHDLRIRRRTRDYLKAKGYVDCYGDPKRIADPLDLLDKLISKLGSDWTGSQAQKVRAKADAKRGKHEESEVDNEGSIAEGRSDTVDPLWDSESGLAEMLGVGDPLTPEMGEDQVMDPPEGDLLDVIRGQASVSQFLQCRSIPNGADPELGSPLFCDEGDPRDPDRKIHKVLALGRMLRP